MSSAGFWTCSSCGAQVPYGAAHICSGRAWPETADGGWPYSDSVSLPGSSLEERRVRALERIADALERIAQEGERTPFSVKTGPGDPRQK